MKSKWVFRLSMTLNILIIAVFVFFGSKYWGFCHNSQSTLTGDNKLASDFQWPEGKKMALSLSFDDAYYSQIDSGIPLFDKYGIKATFFVSVWRLGPKQEAWGKAIANGHEVGNHTYNHPCSVNHNFITGNALEEYTPERMKFELNAENEYIKEMLGLYPVSFAYPCGETFIGKGINTQSYVPLISAMFESGRLYGGGMINPVYCDMSQLPAEQLDGKSFDEIKELIKMAESTGSWLILAGHEIGEGENETSSLSTLEAICKYSMDPSNGIWIDNIHNIASYVAKERGDEPFLRVPADKNPAQTIFSKLWSKYYVFKSEQ